MEGVERVESVERVGRAARGNVRGGKEVRKAFGWKAKVG